MSSALTLANDGVNLVVGHVVSRNLSVFRVNKNTGGLQLLVLQAANTLGTTGSIAGVVSVPPPIVGDFDGDRRADIFWRNKVTGHNRRLVDEWGGGDRFRAASRRSPTRTGRSKGSGTSIPTRRRT